MDGFRMYFSQDLRGPDVAKVLSAGFNVNAQRSREVHVVGPANAYVWLDLSSRSELDPAEDISQTESWAMPPNQLGTLIVIMAKSNDEASQLAVRVARRLVEHFGALITWDGLFGLERLYGEFNTNRRSS
jgi:hypothetical protein